MATNDIKYRLNAQLADNTVTTENTEDKILSLVSAGSADRQRIVSEIMEINPGLERETVAAVLDLKTPPPVRRASRPPRDATTR